MAMFDLQKTAELEQLFRVPKEQRDPGWVRQFFDAVPNASLKTGPQYHCCAASYFLAPRPDWVDAVEKVVFHR